MLLNLLCLELKAEAELVATGVDVLAIQESRESQLDAYGHKDKTKKIKPEFLKYLFSFSSKKEM